MTNNNYQRSYSAPKCIVQAVDNIVPLAQSDGVFFPQGGVIPGEDWDGEDYDE